MLPPAQQVLKDELKAVSVAVSSRENHWDLEKVLHVSIWN